LVGIKRVLIVDSIIEEAGRLEVLVSNAFYPIQIYTLINTHQSEQLLAEHCVDMALIDLALSDDQGLDLVRKIARQAPATIIIVTTQVEDRFILFEALCAGASGYLLKQETDKQQTALLRDAAAGRLSLSASIARPVLAHIRQVKEVSGSYDFEQFAAVLTDREIEIFILIAKGYHVKEISDLLSIACNTVSVHIKSIYRKLNLHNRAEATALAVAMNLYTP